MTQADVLGQPVWYELMTTDPKAAEAFYPAVTGWSAAAFPGLDMPYTLWTRGEAPLAGLMLLPDEARKAGAPPHWMMYVGTPSVDDTTGYAQGLGAQVIVPPTDIPNVGRFAVLSDPQGAVFSVYMSATSAAPAGAPKVGDFSWHELATTDHAAAFDFYRALFDWEQTGVHDMGPVGLYRMFGRQGLVLGGMFNKPAEMPAPPHWLLYVRVDDVQRAVAAVRAGGGHVLNGPMEVPGGDRIAQCLDPQGAAFAVHQLKP